ncbi:MAG: hypothetical protein ACLUD2_00935 [Clostridium sp.]
MERLRAFENHPFKVIADSQMIETAGDSKNMELPAPIDCQASIRRVL